MEFVINGKIKKHGVKKANERLRKCCRILSSYGIDFPPFICGTLNIELEREFSTPNWSNIIFISKKELDKHDDSYNEWWKLIPVKKINREKIPAFILKTETNYHGDKVVELIAHKIDLPDRSRIEILLSDK